MAIMAFAAMLANAQIIKIFIPQDAEPGIPIDTMRYSISYKMTFVNDTSNNPKASWVETMVLESGRHSSYFASLKDMQADSINAEVMKKGGNQYNGGGAVSWRIYKNYPSKGQFSYLENFATDRFVCTDKFDVPAWSLVADSSSTVLGYPCHLAKASYRGRIWFAWYSDDIPLDEGPWLLGGLPGLILKAYDAPRHYQFEAIGMANGNGKQPIMYKGAKFEKVSRRDMNALYKVYYADPVGYITGSGKTKVIIKDENGNEKKGPTNQPYNLIDRQK